MGAYSSVQPVIYSVSAVSSVRGTQRGFVVIGGLKLPVTLKTHLRRLTECFYIRLCNLWYVLLMVLEH